MTLTSLGNIGDMTKQMCTTNDELRLFFRDEPEDGHKFYTPGHTDNVCKAPLLTTAEMKKHEQIFCIIKPTHAYCVSPSSPSSPTSPTSPSSPTSATSPMGDSSTMIMMMCSMAGSFSCVLLIVVVLMMLKKKT